MVTFSLLFWIREESCTSSMESAAVNTGMVTSPRLAVVSIVIAGQGVKGPEGQATPVTESVV